MLSRVAENIYWLTRCLERAEGMARLVSASSQLQLDLPMHVPLSWGSLIDILGGDEDPAENGYGNNEKSVMRYLISDPGNPGSILSSVRQARENARVTRDLLPAEVWEYINALYHYVKDNADGLTSRRKRQDFLHQVVQHSLQITGQIHGSVSRGPGHQFMALGRVLERADMTTRIIDVRYANLFPVDDETMGAYSSVCWMSVLKSLSAYEMYRHDVHGRISGAEVVNYLIKSAQFPRAVAYTLYRAEECLNTLPNGDACLEELDVLRDRLDTTEFTGMSPERMHGLIDDLQRGLGRVHSQITNTYFRFHLAA
ncbi:MAG: alpha-E domain-containing protein [Aquisalimonadaceae bacterium]